MDSFTPNLTTLARLSGSSEAALPRPENFAKLSYEGLAKYRPRCLAWVMAGSAARRMFSTVELRCQECEAVADGNAWGWRALHCGDPDLRDRQLDEVTVAFYCPVCAEAEFGLSGPRRFRREA